MSGQERTSKNMVMKNYSGWFVPEMDYNGTRDILNEWNNKAAAVLKRVEHKRTVIQAGGNVGVFPVGLSKYFEKVYTYEPVDFNFKCLLKNIEGINNIEAVEAGLGDIQGYAEISHITDKNCGAIRLTESNKGLAILTIDEQNFKDVDLIWLDIEGYEYKALKGAKQTLEEYKPLLVLENNGLIHEFPSTNLGSETFRSRMKSEFNYVYIGRMMRDDIYIHQSKII